MKALFTAVLLALGSVGSASAATLSVGPGKTYAAPCAAIAAAKDGDTIEIAGGNTYKGDVCKIVRNGLTIRGVGVRPKIDAAGKISGDKAIWVVDGNDLTVENVEMFGAKSPFSGNGAAFRLEAINFTLRNSFLHDNENGILSNSVPTSNILIEYSEFGHNGRGDGQTHNLYIGRSKSLTFRYNYSHDANVGHDLKSRAMMNMITYNRFSSTPPGQIGSTASGQPSYEIDIPNAGDTYIIGNIIEQPAANQNPAIIAYGEEGATNGTDRLYVINNTFMNDYNSGTFMFISGNVVTPAIVQNNIFVGGGVLSTNSKTIFKNNFRANPDFFVNYAAYDLRPMNSALVVNAASNPGLSATGVSLTPVSQYKATAAGEARPVVGALDIGAFEATAEGASTLAATWTKCAAEGATCRFTGTREVRYGSADIATSKIFTDSAVCGRPPFTFDPAPGVVKTCSYSSATTVMPPVAPSSSWIACAGEGGTCTFTGTRDVRYGTATSYVIKTFTGSVACTNTVFGDPAHGYVKTCSYSSSVK